ncbi:hypothetical protein F6X40_27490 [Paraburkholderia sp. UCT31]|uniref:hypothetical protein n=1 Tax=Paraburkholderia sp. UCT31 TaxID=2615209 RepID=UPI0016555E00|nr:hypothetical protein [Paraburkholderia sp. UCT31]MBC8740405.1 hypothetical protein [Paraburkholderia sp. UCT31]
MSLFSFAGDNPALVILPAIGLVLAAAVVRLKSRYVNEGILFRSRREGARDEVGLNEGPDNRVFLHRYADPDLTAAGPRAGKAALEALFLQCFAVDREFAEWDRIATQSSEPKDLAAEELSKGLSTLMAQYDAVKGFMDEALMTQRIVATGLWRNHPDASTAEWVRAFYQKQADVEALTRALRQHARTVPQAQDPGETRKARDVLRSLRDLLQDIVRGDMASAQPSR